MPVPVPVTPSLETRTATTGLSCRNYSRPFYCSCRFGMSKTTSIYRPERSTSSRKTPSVPKICTVECLTSNYCPERSTSSRKTSCVPTICHFAISLCIVCSHAQVGVGHEAGPRSCARHLGPPFLPREMPRRGRLLDHVRPAPPAWVLCRYCGFRWSARVPHGATRGTSHGGRWTGRARRW